MVTKATKQARPIVPSHAAQRVIGITREVRRDARRGLASEAVLEAGNDAVPSLQGKETNGTETFNIIIGSVQIHLSLILGRLFDDSRKGQHLDDRDVNSIPVLVAWLSVPGCREAMGKRARKEGEFARNDEDAREAECLASIDSALATYGEVATSDRGKNALRRLKEYRDSNLAHNISKPIDFPKYSEVFYLMAEATRIVEDINHACSGFRESIAVYGELHREEADEFWGLALPAIVIKD